MTVLINTFSSHYRRKYRAPVGKIPLHTGHVCPNRRHGGCTYCRASSFTPLYLDQQDSISKQWQRGKAMLATRKFRYLFGYFQQETATALAADRLKSLFSEVLAEPECPGLIISTRPDFLEDDLLDWLQDTAGATGKEFLLELGLQSSHDASLNVLNRNHTYRDFLDAFERIRARDGLQVGVHLILGIPGETDEQMQETVQRVCRLGVDAMKFHHLQVIRATPLHREHERTPVQLFSAKSYLELLTTLLPHVPEQVVIHRLWSTAHPDVLIGPVWDLYSHELSERLNRQLRDRGLFQGKWAF